MGVSENLGHPKIILQYTERGKMRFDGPSNLGVPKPFRHTHIGRFGVSTGGKSCFSF